MRAYMVARTRYTEDQVPLDFEEGSLREAFEGAGLSLHDPCFFTWLGVTSYLSLDAFRRIVRCLASFGTGSGLVADYGVPINTIPSGEQPFYRQLEASVASRGESFRLFLTWDGMRHELGLSPR